MRRLTIAMLALSLVGAACATGPAPGGAPEDAIGPIAERYVRSVLAIGVHEDGYVDAYYGPPEWRAEAESERRALPDIRADIAETRARLAAIDVAALSPLERRRVRYLDAQLSAASARTRMLEGEAFTFDEETEALYGVVAPPTDWAELDAVVARIEEITPGEGPLHERVDRFLAGFEIPADRVDDVLRASIDECRRRTAEHIDLPPGESFTFELVTDQPWSGYNWYQGGYASLIQINVDLPVRLSAAVDLGCHEGYPGHHVFSSLRERRLVDERGWIEFSVFPLFAPDGVIAESTGNLGKEVAFTPAERAAFERDVLSPLAGLDVSDTQRRVALEAELDELWPARIGIARDYLDGMITREEAVARTQRYMLRSAERAEQSVGFSETYRGYVVNYGFGLTLARAHLDREAGDDPDARWAAFERMIATPTIASDLD